MVAQQLPEGLIWSEEFAATREFLARFGIAPREIDHYVDDEVFLAIRAQGWEPEIERMEDPPGWKAQIRERRTLSQSQMVVAYDRDRMTALLRALRLALTWPTPDEEMRAFDEQTRSLLGLSATDFLQRWGNAELSTDDPRVVHLLIARPLGT
ncbi:MAG: hypothetical protein ACR2OO_00350 [Thermomicrobiales bacterium]